MQSSRHNTVQTLLFDRTAFQMSTVIQTYREQMEQELADILGYWMRHTVDHENGGFYGRIDNDNRVYAGAPKGLVLNSRILWSFSAAYNYTGKQEYLDMAHRAYDYISTFFFDPAYDGVYWSLDEKGNRLNDRKQVYGQAFCIYGLSEYYKACRLPHVLDKATALYRLIEKYSYDADRKGYYEAFSRNWQLLDDLRLSEKDANEKKTMNTHLHVIEAYATLYQVWPDAQLKQQIIGLLQVFVQHIIDPQTGHLVLFFDEVWTRRSSILSYGHDIEAAWLLQEVAEILGDETWMERMRQQALYITRAAIEGLDTDGGLWYEQEQGQRVLQKHSWPQAEAMVGFLNAYQLSGDEAYLQHSLNSWRFTQQYIKDQLQGEWFWGVNADYSPMPGQDKAGFWKCPYHNSRACLEVMKRVDALMAGNERR